MMGMRRVDRQARRASAAILTLPPLILLLATACDDDPALGDNLDPGQGSASTGGAADPTGSSGTIGGGATQGNAAGGTTGNTTGGAGSGTSAGSSGSTPMADCSPSGWEDPGTVPNPTLVSVTAAAGNERLMGASKGLEAYGYVQEEFFFTGTSPAYTSRMVVNRPSDPAKFTGTVFVEWFNVSGGMDVAALWAVSREYAMREGHVYVNVSAQKAGADALKSFDAERYAPINHPGDAAANAIFAQAAMAIRAQSEELLGPCMPVDAVIGIGQSQSSLMLGGYVNDAHPEQHIYDGYLLHSNPFGGPPSDPDVPVFVVSTMDEADGRVVDGPNVVEWEVAGASHNDAHLTERGNEELGSVLGITLQCANPLNYFPSFWAYNAALDWLNRWVREGERPPTADPIQTGQVDEHGNALGGVRLPDLDVPIASYTIGNSPKDVFDVISWLGCGLGGSVVPFTEEKLSQLYPTHDDYVQKYTQAADEALAKGYLLPEDYEIAVQQAKEAAVPR